MVVPQHGWFIMDNSTKMDDLGVPQFGTPYTSVNQTWQQKIRHYPCFFPLKPARLVRAFPSGCHV